MKMFVEPDNIYLHRGFVDFRKSVDGLSNIVIEQMQLETNAGSLFIFCNKAKDRLKILYWDNTGFALWYKRLEIARFKWPSKLKLEHIELSDQELNWLLSGYDVVGHSSFTAPKTIS